MDMPNLEEFRKLIAEGSTCIIACARLTNPLKPGTVRNYWCGLCRNEVQVSPRGVDQINAGGVVLCAKCALEIAELIHEQGWLEGIALSPEVKASIERGTIVPRQAEQLDLLLRKKASEYPD